MAKVQINGFVHVQMDYKGRPRYSLFMTDMSGHDGFGMCCGEATFDYEVPADFNPVAKEVEALEKRKVDALRDYQATVSEINDRLSKLQAITYEAEIPTPEFTADEGQPF
jgi:hypothetical protein